MEQKSCMFLADQSDSGVQTGPLSNADISQYAVLPTEADDEGNKCQRAQLQCQNIAISNDIEVAGPKQKR